jgi:DNA-binding CsgD family transcriptional regulator
MAAVGTAASVPGEVDVRAPAGSALTPREREVAAQVSLGLTNSQIAERLVISTGTARIHIERILGKLGLTSRVQIATWVLLEAPRLPGVDRGRAALAQAVQRPLPRLRSVLTNSSR